MKNTHPLLQYVIAFNGSNSTVRANLESELKKVVASLVAPLPQMAEARHSDLFILEKLFYCDNAGIRKIISDYFYKYCQEDKLRQSTDCLFRFMHIFHLKGAIKDKDITPIACLDILILIMDYLSANLTNNNFENVKKLLTALSTILEHLIFNNIFIFSGLFLTTLSPDEQKKINDISQTLDGLLTKIKQYHQFSYSYVVYIQIQCDVLASESKINKAFSNLLLIGYGLMLTTRIAIDLAVAVIGAETVIVSVAAAFDAATASKELLELTKTIKLQSIHTATRHSSFSFYNIYFTVLEEYLIAQKNGFEHQIDKQCISITVLKETLLTLRSDVGSTTKQLIEFVIYKMNNALLLNYFLLNCSHDDIYSLLRLITNKLSRGQTDIKKIDGIDKKVKITWLTVLQTMVNIATAHQNFVLAGRIESLIDLIKNKIIAKDAYFLESTAAKYFSLFADLTTLTVRQQSGHDIRVNIASYTQLFPQISDAIEQYELIRLLLEISKIYSINSADFIDRRHFQFNDKNRLSEADYKSIIRRMIELNLCIRPSMFYDLADAGAASIRNHWNFTHYHSYPPLSAYYFRRKIANKIYEAIEFEIKKLNFVMVTGSSGSGKTAVTSDIINQIAYEESLKMLFLSVEQRLDTQNKLIIWWFNSVLDNLEETFKIWVHEYTRLAQIFLIPHDQQLHLQRPESRKALIAKIYDQIRAKKCKLLFIFDNISSLQAWIDFHVDNGLYRNYQSLVDNISATFIFIGQNENFTLEQLQKIKQKKIINVDFETNDGGVLSAIAQQENTNLLLAMIASNALKTRHDGSQELVSQYPQATLTDIEDYEALRPSCSLLISYSENMFVLRLLAIHFQRKFFNKKRDEKIQIIRSLAENLVTNSGLQPLTKIVLTLFKEETLIAKKIILYLQNSGNDFIEYRNIPHVIEITAKDIPPGIELKEYLNNSVFLEVIKQINQRNLYEQYIRLHRLFRTHLTPEFMASQNLFIPLISLAESIEKLYKNLFDFNARKASDNENRRNLTFELRSFSSKINGESNTTQWQYHIASGMAEFDAGMYVAAEDHFSRALELAKQRSDVKDVIRSAHYSAIVKKYLGNIYDAICMEQNALKLLKVYDIDIDSYSLSISIYNELGNLMSVIDEIEQAITFHKNALTQANRAIQLYELPSHKANQIIEKTIKQIKSDRLTALVRLCYTDFLLAKSKNFYAHNQIIRHDKRHCSFEQFDEELEQLKNEHLGLCKENEIDRAGILVVLAALYLYLQRYAKAVQCINEAMFIYKNLYSDNHPRILFLQLLSYDAHFFNTPHKTIENNQFEMLLSIFVHRLQPLRRGGIAIAEEVLLQYSCAKLHHYKRDLVKAFEYYSNTQQLLTDFINKCEIMHNATNILNIDNQILIQRLRKLYAYLLQLFEDMCKLDKVPLPILGRPLSSVELEKLRVNENVTSLAIRNKIEQLENRYAILGGGGSSGVLAMFWKVIGYQTVAPLLRENTVDLQWLPGQSSESWKPLSRISDYLIY